VIDAVMLQVRLDSSRLPGKALLKLGDLTVIEHAMRALLLVSCDHHLLVTDQESARLLEPIADKWGFSLFAGPKDDVLKRYALAVDHLGADRVIRATGDNPLVSPFMANRLLELQIDGRWDYSGFIGPPLGTGVELLRASALLEADREATEPYEREHVSPFLYKRPDRFLIARIEAPEELSAPDMRVTLDTQEDYHLLRQLYAECYRGEPIEIDQIISLAGKVLS